MSDVDVSGLSPPVRLALAYAPARSREAMAAVFALDARLGKLGAKASEPVITQIKLAWWRDQFGGPVESWARGEPVLERLAGCGVPGEKLIGLVDGWEILLIAANLDAEVAQGFAQGRASACAAVTLAVGEGDRTEAAMEIGRLWALAELAPHLSQEDANLAASPSMAPRSGAPAALPRALRPLAVLDALARRSLQRRAPMLDGPGALALAMRVGIFGR